MQQDPVGLITFDTQIAAVAAGQEQADAARAGACRCSPSSQPTGETDIAKSLVQVAAMLRQRSLVMMFSDLLTDPEPVKQALARLRHGGHDVILFHILDEAEVTSRSTGLVELEEPEGAGQNANRCRSFPRAITCERDPRVS